MKPLEISFRTKNEKILIITILSLFVVSLFHNLGIAPLVLEEPRRAIVAIEMLFSGNFIVPTEFGAFYYIKPPVWNWIIILAFKIFGSYSEFAVRFFTPVFHLLTGFLIFQYCRKYISFTTAVVASVCYLVCGDLFLYFVILGEIDIFYSYITVLMLFLIFRFDRQEKYWQMYIWTYTLMAIGFLTKSFPSIAFLGVSLLALAFLKRKIKFLFHPAHFVGVFVFILIVFGYFYVYSLYNKISSFMDVLVEHIKMRTASSHSFGDLLANLFIFPGNFILNNFPALLMLIFIPFKKFRSAIKENEFVRFVWFILLANAALYWISPGTRQRYVYMLYPLWGIVLSYFFTQNFHTSQIKQKIFDILAYFIAGAAGLAILISIFIPNFNFIPLLWAKLTFVFLIFILVFLWLKKLKWNTLFFIVIGMIAVRFVFNFTILPERDRAGEPKVFEESAKIIAQMTKGQDVYMFEGSLPSRVFVFYYEREKNAILPFTAQKDLKAYYIIKQEDEHKIEGKEVYRFHAKNMDYILKLR